MDKCNICYESIVKSKNDYIHHVLKISQLETNEIICECCWYSHITCFIEKCNKERLLGIPGHGNGIYLFGLVMSYVHGDENAIDLFKNFKVVHAFDDIIDYLIEYIKIDKVIQNQLSNIKNIKNILNCMHGYYNGEYKFIQSLKAYVSTLPFTKKYALDGFLSDFEVFQYVKFSNIRLDEFYNYCYIISGYLLDVLNDTDIIYLLILSSKKHKKGI